jgi:hypothetical protein
MLLSAMESESLSTIHINSGVISIVPAGSGLVQS